jgi:hypothetical protein
MGMMVRLISFLLIGVYFFGRLYQYMTFLWYGAVALFYTLSQNIVLFNLLFFVHVHPNDNESRLT